MLLTNFEHEGNLGTYGTQVIEHSTMAHVETRQMKYLLEIGSLSLFWISTAGCIMLRSESALPDENADYPPFRSDVISH
jgi:hypothetical protein